MELKVDSHLEKQMVCFVFYFLMHFCLFLYFYLYIYFYSFFDLVILKGSMDIKRKVSLPFRPQDDSIDFIDEECGKLITFLERILVFWM